MSPVLTEGPGSPGPRFLYLGLFAGTLDGPILASLAADTNRWRLYSFPFLWVGQ
jgi:hypothetical protein